MKDEIETILKKYYDDSIYPSNSEIMDTALTIARLEIENLLIKAKMETIEEMK